MMSPTESKAEIRRPRNARPFQSFLLELANGHRILIEYPENIAFDPVSDGGNDFYFVTRTSAGSADFSAITKLLLQ